MFRKLWNIIIIIYRYLKRNVTLKRVALAVNVGVAISILFLTINLFAMFVEFDNKVGVFRSYIKREIEEITTAMVDLGILTVKNDLSQIEIMKGIIGTTGGIQDNIENINKIIEKLREHLALSKLIKIENIEDIKKANFEIMNITEGRSGSGSHIKIGNKSYVLTCAHLSKETEDHLWAFIGKDRFPLELIKIDRHFDLALYRIHKSMKNFPCLEISDEYPKEGSEIVVIGNPANMEDVITDGVIAKIEKDKYIFTNKVYFGNSGGSMLYRGKIVGVVISTFVYYKFPVIVNYGKAVRLKVINFFLEDIN